MSGPLPIGWTETELADVADFSAGRTPLRSDAAYWQSDPGTGVPWVSIGDMRPYRTVADTAEHISQAALSEVFGGNVVPRGTLLMSFKLTIGRIAILGIDACHNEAIVS